MIDILSGKVLMNILRSLKRDERMVNITVFYDLDEVEKNGYKLLQKKRQKK